MQMVKLHIKEHRLEKGYTVEYMSRQLNISKSYFSEIENGKYQIKLKLLCKIAHILEVETYELYECIHLEEA